jgi:hypothetical protein
VIIWAVAEIGYSSGWPCQPRRVAVKIQQW